MPRIAVVGRPNVGKSSLLNMMARAKVSIVDDTAGTTRDRVSVIVDLIPPGGGDDSSRYIRAEVTDTGGYGVYTVDGRRFDDVGADLATLTDDIEFQINQAVQSADVVLFVIDAQAGITAHDQTIARLLRERVLGKGARTKHGKTAGPEGEAEHPRPHQVKIVVVANKCDGPRWEAHAYEAAAMGFGEPIPVSAKNNYFRRDFLDRLYEEVATVPGVTLGTPADDPALTGVKFAIIGKRNAGKSSLVNTLAGQPRVIVSEIAGTTRDAVDVRFELDGRVFTAIDTAGLRKKKSFADRIEWWAFDRAVRAVERADVVLLLIDATLPPSQVDQHLAQMVSKSYKPAVIVVNKWDLVEGRSATAGKHKGKPISIEMYEEYLRAELKGLSLAPISFISAKGKTNVKETIRLAIDLFEQAGQRVSTGKLNRVLRRILETRGPTSKLGTFAKVFFAAQVRTHPPTIVMVVNRPELFTPNYMRFLLGAMRKHLPFPEVPINMIIKKRERARMHDLQEGAEEAILAAAGLDSDGDDAQIAARAFEELGVDASDAIAAGTETDVSKYFDDDDGDAQSSPEHGDSDDDQIVSDGDGEFIGEHGDADEERDGADGEGAIDDADEPAGNGAPDADPADFDTGDGEPISAPAARKPGGKRTERKDTPRRGTARSTTRKPAKNKPARTAKRGSGAGKPSTGKSRGRAPAKKPRPSSTRAQKKPAGRAAPKGKKPAAKRTRR